MRAWTSLHCHSCYSYLDGISKPQQIIEASLAGGLSGSAISDHGNLAGTIAYLKAKKNLVEKYEKLGQEGEPQLAKLKAFRQILGCELYLCKEDASIKSKENGGLAHLVVLAKNEPGWKELIRLTNDSNREENFYRKPRLSLNQLSHYTKGGNLITFSGHMGSELADAIFVDTSAAYDAKTYDEAKQLVDPKWKEKCYTLIGRYQEIFGKENFYLEIQRIDEANLPAAKIVAQALRFLGERSDTPKLATADSHYSTRERVEDQRVVICNMMNTTMKQVMRAMAANSDEVGLAGFFRSDNYHIPTLAEMNELHTEDELDNSMQIAAACEDYSPFRQPSFPKFDCPDDLSSKDYLRHLCREGFKKKELMKHARSAEYVARAVEELDVLGSYDVLTDYFLVTHDWTSAARARGEILGGGRGSAGGCLVSYLLGITALDPIEYDLSFARFFNKGRCSPGKVSLPDIDIDLEIDKAQLSLMYIQEKYGEAHVAQMGTFARMLGCSVLKDVLRVHEACSPEEANRITEHIPAEADIADQLQLMVEDGDEPSIVKWALLHNAKELKEWCVLEDGQLSGPLAPYFAQAIRLEGNVRGTSKHASGVILAGFNISENIPMMRDKSSDKLITGIPMGDVEACGGPKLDLLKVAVLSKIKSVSNMLRTGDLRG